MKWDKKGIIFDPIGKFNWSLDTALQPTPLIFEDRIRVYIGSRDQAGISRVGYFDCARSNPEIIIGWSNKPVLDIGADGCFDDNGVVPSAVFRKGEEIWMYYAGYQLCQKVRFLVLGGLAISKDNGETFQRYQNVPILERTNTETLFRVIHTVFQFKNCYKVWYGGGSFFMKEKEKTYPVYDIRVMESNNGLDFPVQGEIAIRNEEDEYRVGRPNVVFLNNKYYMFFGASKLNSPYRLSYAISEDSTSWRREYQDFGLSYEKDDFDSEMSAYPTVVEIDGNIWLMYNGNDYGYQGVGLAKLINF
jgi:hypothetical protein